MSTYGTRQVESLSGYGFKLMSEKGTLLGTLGVPGHVATCLRQTGGCRFVLWPADPYCRPPSADDVVGKVGTLVAVYGGWRSLRDAVQLQGVSIEEVEKEPGFSFAPSAAYIRSLME